MATNRRFILLIYGVKLSDVRKVLNTSTSSHAQKDKARDTSQRSESLIDFANYSKIPHIFTTIDQFPKSTNLLCWSCHRSFTSQPRFIAIESIRAIGRDAYDWIIEGNFCSWACAAAYIEQHYADTKKWSLRQNLAVVRAQIDGTKIQLVKPAPCHTKMRSYCGADGMSQQDYSELVESLSKV